MFCNYVKGVDVVALDYNLMAFCLLCLSEIRCHLSRNFFGHLLLFANKFNLSKNPSNEEVMLGLSPYTISLRRASISSVARRAGGGGGLSPPIGL